MPHLSLRLFGSFEATLDGVPVTAFESDKVRGLLAYLAVEADRSHARDRLAGLLWPEVPQRRARDSLRNALASLRTAIGDRESSPPYLRITRQAIQFNIDSDHDVDASVLSSTFARGSLDLAEHRLLEQALLLYRGRFLEGLSIPGSAAFEEWAVQVGEELHRKVVRSLGELATHYEALGALEMALSYSRRQVALEPWSEEAHLGLIRLLALLGRRTDAIGQFNSMSEVLAAELGLEPSADAVRLFRRVRDGEAVETESAAGEPGFRGYEIHELVGSSASAAVYRATQPYLKREVAIKVIQPDHADDPGFIRRFEAEARMIAQFEHPHVVPLYDFWREPGRAHLVMRWLRGGSLKRALATAAWPRRDIGRVLDQVASALGAAHARGILHGNVKPTNVLLDNDGNAYLTDFGIATIGTDHHPLSPALSASDRSSPEYRAPELLRGGAVTQRSDIYSLGMVLFALLTGTEPWGPATAVLSDARSRADGTSGISLDLHGVLTKATAADPDARFSDVSSFAEALRTALAADVGAGPRGAIRNPYKGLRPFTEADSADFYGRQGLVERLLDRLTEQVPGARFLAVVGPSGSGKSSVVRSGLVAELRKGAIPQSDEWFIFAMTPGAAPFRALADAVMRFAVDPPDRLVARLRSGELTLADALQEALPGGHVFLLIIDQFEELFTQVADKDERQRFFEVLLTAVGSAPRIRIVITLRADFFDKPLEHPQLGDLVRRRTELVLPLSEEDLHMAITGPAEAAGVNFEPGLAQRIASDVHGEPGGLPLLQYALAELFDRRSDARLEVSAYEQIGGTAGAVAGRADEIVDAFDARKREQVKRLFLRLVTVNDHSEETKRRVSRAAVAAIGDDVDQIIEVFGGARLLTFDIEPRSRAPTIEIAHEALLREWATLRGWIADARGDLETERRLAIAAAEWEAADEEPAYLLRGARLDVFRTWLDRTDIAVGQKERRYVKASITAEDDLRREDEYRAAEEESLRRRATRRLLLLAGVLVGAVLLAAGLTVVALARAGEERQQNRLATARELAAASVANLEVDPQLSILLALEAADATLAADGYVTPEAEDALHRSIQASRVLFSFPAGFGVAYAADGSLLATSGEGGITLRRPDTGAIVRTLAGDGAEIINVAFSQDGRRIAATATNRTATVWDAKTGNMLNTFSGHEGRIGSPALNHDGSLLATTGEDGTARVWDVATGTQLQVLQHPEATTGIAFDNSGSRLVVGSMDETASLWAASTGEKILTSPYHGFAVTDVVFSPSGDRFATSSFNSSAAVWDSKTGTQVLSLEGRSPLTTVDYSSDGSLIATGGLDGRVRVFDAMSGDLLLVLAGHTQAVVNVAFRPNGSHLTSGSEDGTAKVWDVRPEAGREWLTLSIQTGWVGEVEFAPDGSLIAAPSGGGVVTIWETQTGTVVQTLTGHTEPVFAVDFSIDGRLIATGGVDGTVRLWQVDDGRSLGVMAGHEGWVNDVDISPDGAIVSAGESGDVRVWNVRTLEPMYVLQDIGGGASVRQVAFDPSGSLVAAGAEDGTVGVWDATTGRPRLIAKPGFDQGIFTLGFSPDGSLLASAGADGKVRVLDTRSGEKVLTLSPHTGQVDDLAFSPDGATIATASADGTSKLMDVETGEVVLTLSDHSDLVASVAFSPDGRFLATSSVDGTARVHVLAIEDLIAVARERTLRSLTEDECRRYLHIDVCPVLETE